MATSLLVGLDPVEEVLVGVTRVLPEMLPGPIRHPVLLGLGQGTAAPYPLREPVRHCRQVTLGQGPQHPPVHRKGVQLAQGLFYFKVEDSDLMSAIFRTYNDWLAEFCETNPGRLKGIAMINLDNVVEGIQELERSAKLGLVGAMITEYPAEERRYDGAEYEPFWAAAQDLNMPLSLHTATARTGPNRAAGPTSVRTASGRANKVFLPATSLCDMIFSGVFERYPRLNVAVVEFELAWAPHLLQTMDYTYIERQKEASYRFKGDVLPSDFFHRNVYLSFQEDGIGIRMRDVIGVDCLMWGSDYPHAESTFPKSWEILESILEGVPLEEKAQIVGATAAQLYGFDANAIKQG